MRIAGTLLNAAPNPALADRHACISPNRVTAQEAEAKEEPGGKSTDGEGLRLFLNRSDCPTTGGGS